MGTLAFSIMVPAAVTLLLPWLVLRADPAAQSPAGFRWLGLLPAFAGSVLYIWSAWGFAWIGRGTPLPSAPPGVLVIWGPYRWIRNPMYVAVLAVLVGEAVLFRSYRLLVVAAGLFAAFHLFVTFYEERRLLSLFGGQYQDYLASVGRWLPRSDHGTE